MSLSLVSTFAQIRVGTTFQFDPDGATYMKLSRDRYQLLDRAGQPVPGMTYNLRWRNGQHQPVLPDRKAA